MAETGSEPEATFELELLLPPRPLLPKNVVSLGLPETPSPLKVAVTPQETLNDLRTTLNDSPEGYWLGAFSFRRPSSHSQSGEVVNEWLELREVFEGVPPTQRVLQVSHEPFNSAEVRLHIQRLRDLLSGTSTDPTALSIDAGVSVHDAVCHAEEWAEETRTTPPTKPTWSGWPADTTSQLLPASMHRHRVLPKCVRGMSLSAWNPPPKPMALQGHLLYLQIDTLEGEILHVTACENGFFINGSSSQRFQPQPHPTKKIESASLFDLLCAASPLFLQNFARLFNDPVSTRDYFSALPVMNSLPAVPWLARVPKHDTDPMRLQSAFLLTGALTADSIDASRDWNEELQSSRELPRSTLAERLLRDRVLNRLQAEFALAAARAVPRVAAGEVAPMNPADAPQAHMYLFNNLFVTRGIDSVDMYEFLGGDAAAHAAVGKDAQGVRIFSALDTEGLHALGTVVVDWLGERWVVQTVLPGLFRQVAAEAEAAAAAAEQGTPEAEAHADAAASSTHVAYGGVEGPDTIHVDPTFHERLQSVAKRLHLAEHAVSDAQGTSHQLALSVDCKGLRGTDGRMYVLDLSRLAPVDVAWLEQDMKAPVLEGKEAASYPHHMALLRPELIEAYWDSRLREFARAKLAHQREEGGETPARIDVADFDLSFNPDAFVEYKSGSSKVVTPVCDESEAAVAAVRAASTYLREEVLVRLVSEVAAGLASAVDSVALTQQMHARGINMRYLGHLAHLSQSSERHRLDETVVSKLGSGHEALLTAFRRVVIQEMIVRAAKHRLRSYLRGLPMSAVSACVAHFFNCLFGTAKNASPEPVVPSPALGRASASYDWLSLTPAQLQQDLQADVRDRFRFELPADSLTTELRKPQALRALCWKMGVQLELRDYEFEPTPEPTPAPASSSSHAPASKGKKGKKSAAPVEPPRATTFVPSDVLCLAPVVKTATPKSSLVEEAFEAGRLSFSRGDRELGTELLLEGIGFHEQVYGLVHPETAKCYSLFASLVHHYVVEFARETAEKAAKAKAKAEQAEKAEQGEQAESAEATESNDEEKEAPLPPIVAETFTIDNALRFQRQAVTVSERTQGLDHPDTMVQYINLAVLERSAGHFDVALRYQERIMQLWQLLYGRDHPDVVHTLSSIALLLQSRHDFDTSLKAYQASYDLALQLFGSDSIYTGNMAHELSQAHTLSGDLKSAIHVEKDAARVFKACLGDEDPLTKESEAFLSGLAASAVRMAKVEEAARHQHVRELVAASQAPRTQTTTAASRTVHANPALADRSLDDLVQYIQGAPGTGTSRAARKRAARHRRT
ncbi:Intracellular distribution of mitochondria [Malassezia pachydermatis]|uniref:Clustered mitochondria protein homolog n=1 Tax=Malassezia pachydermatis TaxID=77020 RepID=A0A0M8MTZ5_9BASI|nr:eukaryotic translation initiation factor 3 subunit clu1 [Malassezia pachydermatis]KOS13561.1 eukaryotic translation initiation factor 3 subunit clu1 [Malassezia pachydermatis]